METTFADCFDEKVNHELHYDDFIFGQEYHVLLKDIMNSKVFKRNVTQVYLIFEAKLLSDILDLRMFKEDEFKLHVSKKSFLKAFDIALREKGFQRIQLNKKGTYHIETKIIRHSRYVLELKDLIFSKFSDKLR